MIHINLLPEEYRKKARTPIKLLLAVALCVAVNGSLAAYWAFLAFGVATEVETLRTSAQVEMDGLTPQVNYHNALLAETRVYQSREQTLADITTNRVRWTRKVDELIDVVNAGDDSGRHYIWFDDLSVAQSEDRRGKSFGKLSASGHSGSEKWDQVADFLDDLVDPGISAFIRDFETPERPQANQSSKDPDLIPSEVWSFPLAAELKSPKDRAEAAEAATKAAEATISEEAR